MLFGLYNTPSTFQSYINETLVDYLDDFCSAYLDDVLIFSKTLKEHRIYVRRVLERLIEAKLFIDIDKCEFEVQKVIYLGFIISIDGVRMDLAKIRTILE